MKLPEPYHSIEAMIDKWHEDQKNELRPHLGASILGEPCARKIWYLFRWAPNLGFEGRILRLFRRGAKEEDDVVADLLRIGCKVEGRQRRVDFGDFVSGSIDGIVHGVPQAPSAPHLLEIKTHNKKSFDALYREGVQKSKPVHFAQMQAYMLGLGLERALYFAVCKDDDRIYTERVKLDQAGALDLVQRAKDVARSTTPPRRISENPSWYECKFCSVYAICHQGEAPRKSCRTCEHGEPKYPGWYCRHHGADIPREVEVKGCEMWRAIK
jgi:hypothetical protein